MSFAGNNTPRITTIKADPRFEEEVLDGIIAKLMMFPLAYKFMMAYELEILKHFNLVALMIPQD
jgi:hypothetical protein